MPGAKDHLFQFQACQIADAARESAVYHRQRVEVWRQRQDEAEATVKATATIEIKRQPVTGGERVEVTVNYGDPTAYGRLQESFNKMQSHRQKAERYESDAILYGTQAARMYELTGDDVAYFHLNGAERDA